MGDDMTMDAKQTSRTVTLLLEEIEIPRVRHCVSPDPKHGREVEGIGGGIKCRMPQRPPSAL